MDITAIGELLMDMTPKTDEGVTCFVPNPGGAPCNFLAIASVTGVSTRFIGKVGDDRFGGLLKQTLDSAGILTDGLVLDARYPTTLAFVHLNESGERSFSFYRKYCADVSLELDDVDLETVKNTRVMHFGSLSFTDEPIRSTVLEVVKAAKESGAVLTYDPNYRPLLWDNPQTAVEGMKLGLRLADIVKVSDEEALLISGKPTLEEAVDVLLSYGVKMICMTLGGEGAAIYTNSYRRHIGGFESKVVDTTGAGDVFFGAFVSYLAKNTTFDFPIGESHVVKAATYANAAASLCVESYGGIPSIPSYDAILARMSNG
ncbi:MULTISPECIES: carbohydrate kinase [unclassified Fusibacter]|uniref:carbohydrate kinase family protein n=1 Tax=unclassified Fusibacter TaxID=2624464 RepID=UPI001013C2EA|nr:MULTISPECIES: carbohydrate kinase [unclassified Fusibacter]MCK8058628.1 carbohydrate kinase [Fusibacter sp. A2]NPE21703.1 carbohydrate kinase [Fusibacter sp. A1]RXV61278.1 carbohydrate kinase [Fusibacter sp. A1]